MNLDYCGSGLNGVPFGNVYLNLIRACPCTGSPSGTQAAGYEPRCPDGNLVLSWGGLQPGTYYIPVALDAAHDAAGPYTIHVIAKKWYCDSHPSSMDTTLTRFQLGSIDNSTVTCDTYNNFTFTNVETISTNLTQGVTYPALVSISNCTPTNCEQRFVWVWADWNQDGVFSNDAEWVYDSGYISFDPCDRDVNFDLAVPPDAPLGVTRLRVIVTDGLDGAGNPIYENPVPCGYYISGATEDYTVDVVSGYTPGACCLPVAPYCAQLSQDECQAQNGAFLGWFVPCPLLDCDGDGQPDTCAMALGAADCNINGSPDNCDIINGVSVDCQPDGIPDECQLGDALHVYRWDDGSSESMVGLSHGGEICWIQHFTVSGSDSRTITGIQTCFGSPLFPVATSGVYAGEDFRVFIWSDPDGDGNPADAVLLQEEAATIRADAIATDVLQTVPLNPTVNLPTTSFFVGAAVIIGYGYPAPMDQNGTLAHETWLAYAAPPFNPNPPMSNLATMDSWGLPCNFLLRAVGLHANDLNANWVPDECDSGACCFPDGHCETKLAAACATAGGRYRGDLTVCDPSPCEQPEAACCYLDGSCATKLAAECTGTWLGFGSACSPNPCVQPQGACCHPDGSCAITLAVECPGTWFGYGSVCAPNPCPQPGCAGDTNCDTVVNFADVDPFVEALYGESRWNQAHPGCPWLSADCNHDGRVTFADIDPFVALLGTTCPP